MMRSELAIAVTAARAAQLKRALSTLRSELKVLQASDRMSAGGCGGVVEGRWRVEVEA